MIILPFAVQHVRHAHVDDEPDEVFGLPVRPNVSFLRVHRCSPFRARFTPSGRCDDASEHDQSITILLSKKQKRFAAFFASRVHTHCNAHRYETERGGGRPRTGSRAWGPHRRRARYRAGSVPAPAVGTAAIAGASGAHARALVPPRTRRPLRHTVCVYACRCARVYVCCVCVSCACARVRVRAPVCVRVVRGRTAGRPYRPSFGTAPQPR